MYERFTDRARKVMQLANQEAQRFNHEYIGTEDILLGLAAEGSGVAANVLKNLDVNLRKIRQEIEKIVQHGPGGEQVVTGQLPQTPRTKKVIEYAIDEARALHHNYVGTEHLLLGLLREREGVAAEVLKNLGLNLEGVREEVLNLLGNNLPTPPVGPLTYPLSGDICPAKLTREKLQIARDWIERLNVQKEEAVMQSDFERAVCCRDEADILEHLLAWYEWFNRK